MESESQGMAARRADQIVDRSRAELAGSPPLVARRIRAIAEYEYVSAIKANVA